MLLSAPLHYVDTPDWACTFNYNQDCAYVGEHTPAFIVLTNEIPTNSAPSREGRQTQTHQQTDL